MTKLSDLKRPRFHKPSAYHEAGHAVVAVALGIAVESISVHPDKSRGTLEWYSSAPTNLECGENPYGDEGVIILLAGAAAQKKHAPSSMRWYTAIGDYDKVQTLVFHGVKAEHEGYAVFKKRWDWLVAETTKITEANWHVIDAVARRLLIVGEITGNEVKTIFRQSKGIRQRLSKDPRRYERFHAASDARKSYL